MHQIEVSPDGKTVWVNSGTDGSCIGRFSKKFGMDVHYTGTEQMEGKGECLHCTHEPANWNDWLIFRTLMKNHYQIDIPINTITFKGSTHESRR